MELTDDGSIENYAKKCMPCMRDILSPSQYELKSFSCGYYVIRRKTTDKTSTKKSKL